MPWGDCGQSDWKCAYNRCRLATRMGTCRRGSSATQTTTMTAGHRPAAPAASRGGDTAAAAQCFEGCAPASTWSWARAPVHALSLWNRVAHRAAAVSGDDTYTTNIHACQMTPSTAASVAAAVISTRYLKTRVQQIDCASIVAHCTLLTAVSSRHTGR